MIYRNSWLPHLKDSIPPAARLNRVSLYTIALEGWRRGLELDFTIYKDEQNIQRIQYSLTDGNRTHTFNESSGDYNDHEAFAICNNKHLTEKYLQSADVPIPKGKTFDITTPMVDMLKYASELGFPLVVKPSDGSGGKGVYANITHSTQLKDAIHNLKNNKDVKNIIIQRFVQGEEIRLYVLDDMVLSAVNRIPANVVGDGETSIIKLIKYKNEIRKSVPHLYHRPIKVDRELKENLASTGYQLDDVPNIGERIYLRKTSNISTGGDPIEILDELTDRQKEIAVRATKCIPGLKHSGVDMIVNSAENYAVVLEVNTKPGIGSHLFPIEGEAKDIPKYIIDYYFPSTKNKERLVDYYFDIQSMFDSFYGGYNSQLTVAPCPNESPVIKQLHLETDSELMDVYHALKKIIFSHQINGFMFRESKQYIQLIIAHLDDDVLLEVDTIIKQSENKLGIKNITNQLYEKPIKVGFEMIDDLKELGLHELEQRLNYSKQNLKKVNSENNRLLSRIKRTEDSLSWRITTPLRAIMNFKRRK